MVSKRLELPAGYDPPEPGTVIYGRRDSWRLTAATPIESRIWPNSWRLSCDQLGAHGLDRSALDRLDDADDPMVLVFGPIGPGEGPEDVWPWLYQETA